MGKNNIMKTYTRFDITFEKGIGTKLYDSKGKEYLDFISGIAVNCLGHCHPTIVKAIETQSKTLIHTSGLYWNTAQIDLAKKLTADSNHNQVFYCNSGTEAVETSLKIARKYGKTKGGDNKNEILYMENSFHGRTYGALSVMGIEKYKQDFMPVLPGVKSVKFNDIEDLKCKISENTCGIILEPIQGEGGMNVADKGFLEAARALCDQHDAILIFDEVQCGMGRTGELFAYQSFDVIPDVICLAKGLGGGFPIGATLANEKTGDVLVPGDHGSTFGGNPLSCAVSVAVLEELTIGGVVKEVKDKSEYLVEKLEKLQQRYPAVIKGMKGMGLLLGMDFSDSPKVFIQKCFEKGLLLLGAGGNVIRLTPPLNVTKKEIDAAVAIIEKSLEEISVC